MKPLEEHIKRKEEYQRLTSELDAAIDASNKISREIKDEEQKLNTLIESQRQKVAQLDEEYKRYLAERGPDFDYEMRKRDTTLTSLLDNLGKEKNRLHEMRVRGIDGTRLQKLQIAYNDTQKELMKIKAEIHKIETTSVLTKHISYNYKEKKISIRDSDMILDQDDVEILEYEVPIIFQYINYFIDTNFVITRNPEDVIDARYIFDSIENSDSRLTTFLKNRWSVSITPREWYLLINEVLRRNGIPNSLSGTMVHGSYIPREPFYFSGLLPKAHQEIYPIYISESEIRNYVDNFYRKYGYYLGNYDITPHKSGVYYKFNIVELNDLIKTLTERYIPPIKNSDYISYPHIKAFGKHMYNQKWTRGLLYLACFLVDIPLHIEFNHQLLYFVVWPRARLRPFYTNGQI